MAHKGTPSQAYISEQKRRKPRLQKALHKNMSLKEARKKASAALEKRIAKSGERKHTGSSRGTRRSLGIEPQVAKPALRGIR